MANEFGKDGRLAKFTIDRSKWARGAASSLGPREGRQCCLGIYLSACGFPDKDLAGTLYVRSFEDDSRVAPAKWLLGPSQNPKHHHIEIDFTTVNDDSLLTDEEREERLKSLFAEHGVEVTFQG